MEVATREVEEKGLEIESFSPLFFSSESKTYNAPDPSLCDSRVVLISCLRHRQFLFARFGDA